MRFLALAAVPTVLACGQATGDAGSGASSGGNSGEGGTAGVGAAGTSGATAGSSNGGASGSTANGGVSGSGAQPQAQATACFDWRTVQARQPDCRDEIRRAPGACAAEYAAVFVDAPCADELGDRLWGCANRCNHLPCGVISCECEGRAYECASADCRAKLLSWYLCASRACGELPGSCRIAGDECSADPQCCSLECSDNRCEPATLECEFCDDPGECYGAPSNRCSFDENCCSQKCENGVCAEVPLSFRNEVSPAQAGVRRGRSAVASR